MYIIIFSNKFIFFYWFVDVFVGICILNVIYMIGWYMWNMCMYNESEFLYIFYLVFEIL